MGPLCVLVPGPRLGGGSLLAGGLTSAAELHSLQGPA